MLGTRRHLYSNWETGKIHVGSYTMRTGVQEQTLKQSTYQIPRSFTTCACAIFMGQRSNNKNEPCGSWALSHWLTEQRGRGGRRLNQSLGGPKNDGMESKRGVEWSAQGCDRADWRWPGLTWVSESGAEDMLM